MADKRLDNLAPFTSDQSREEAVKNGRKGGIASGEARRRKKDLKKIMKRLMEQKPTPENQEFLRDAGVSEDDMSNYAMVAVGALLKAASGDVGAMRFIADMTGTMSDRDRQKSRIEKERLELEREKLDLEKEKQKDDQPDDKVVIINDLEAFTDGSENNPAE